MHNIMTAEIVAGLQKTPNLPRHLELNDDLLTAQAQLAQQPSVLSRLIGWVRRRREERAYARRLTALWNLSPHLLDDIGVVTEFGPGLPDALLPAPQAVLDHIASAAPAPHSPTPTAATLAEPALPPQPEPAVEPEAEPARTDRAPAPALILGLPA